MIDGSPPLRLFVPVLLVVLLLAAPAQAYIGPGLGLGAIGAFFGALLAGAAAFFGFFWYPIKRMRRKRQQKRDERQQKRDERQQKSEPSARSEDAADR